MDSPPPNPAALEPVVASDSDSAGPAAPPGRGSPDPQRVEEAETVQKLSTLSPSQSATAGDSRAPGALNSPLPPPIPDYELLRRIGSGSYGDVWLARNILGQCRAVKIIYRTRFADPRPFEREFEGIQSFEPISRSHPSQLHILHVGKNDAAGCFFYVMELADSVGTRSTASDSSDKIRDDVEVVPTNADSTASAKPVGTGSTPSDSPDKITDGVESVPTDPLNYLPHTLRHDLQQYGRLPIPDCVQIGLSLATALAHLHEQGLVHRDIKPSNIIFVSGVAKLGDIGLVTDAGDTQSIVGTEGYLPPEGPGTPQADLFSLGKVLYEMSTGMDRRRFAELPDDLRSWEDRTAVVEFNEIVLKACAKDPARRYSSAAELRADFALLQEGKSVKRARGNQRLWMAATKASVGSVLLSLVIAGVVAYLRNNEPSGLLAISLLTGDGTSGTKNLKAAEAYRLGLPALRRGTREGFRQAVQSFTTATEEDPRFVAAYARLIESYLLDEDRGIGFIDGKPEKLASLTATMEKIAPTNAETLSARAVVKFVNEWKWIEAETEFWHALQLDPNCRMALTHYGYLLTRLGRGKEAETMLNRALRLDPTSPLLTKYLGHCDFLARDFDKALQFYLKASDLEPSYLSSRYWAARCYLAMTNYLQAIEESARWDRKTGRDLPEDYHAKLREAFEKDGPIGYWKMVMELRRAIHDDPANYSHYFEAECHARLGDTKSALDQLEQALAKREGASDLVIDEFWDRYRLNSRFQSLLHATGVPVKPR